MIFKNLVLQALGIIWFRFLQKKSKKNFHACVPLRAPPCFWLAIWKPIGIAAMKIHHAFVNVGTRFLVFTTIQCLHFWGKQTGLSPIFFNLHRQAQATNKSTYTCYTDRMKTKGKAGTVLVLKNIERHQWAIIFNLQLEKPQQKTPLRPSQCR